MRLCRLTILLLAACDANHTVGLDNDPLSNKCCVIASTGQKVDSCASKSNCFCDPMLCKKGSQCQTVKDCPSVSIPCLSCSDGSTSCPEIDCTNGQCVATVFICQTAGCQTDADCGSVTTPTFCQACPDGTCATVSTQCLNGQCSTIQNGCATECTDPKGCTAPASCLTCPDGTSACAQADCVSGKCVVSYPNCTPLPGKCTTDADCGTSACTTCPDGSQACSKFWCANGVCQGGTVGCPPAGCKSDSDCTGGKVCRTGQCYQPCGGIVARPCTAPNTMCVDDPTDNCDPTKGGADCPGLCESTAPSTGCKSNNDCPQLGAPCRLCSDGKTFSCPGQCLVDGTCGYGPCPL
jgi:hypothetical protein